MDLKLIRKLYDFYIDSNIGFGFDVINKFQKYTIVYNNEIKDHWYNFITDIKAENKQEFDNIILEASKKMRSKNRIPIIAILPLSGEFYNNKELFFDKSDYELISNEVWQIYDNFDNIKNINTYCDFNVNLEKTTNMKLYAEEFFKAYQTLDDSDPYGNLDSAYKEKYSNFNSMNNKRCTEEFFLVKVNNEIVGVSQGIYDDEIYGIYGLAVKKEFRCKGIGKEIIKKQLHICKEKKLKIAFLQTEDRFYPADIYRKIGFKDVCIEYYYKINKEEIYD